MTMTLSESIKAGAKLRRQAFSGLVGADGHGGLGSCALGAAAESVGHLVISDDLRSAHSNPGPLKERFPLLNQSPLAELPCGCEIAPRTVAGAITHLNDTHLWRRETIAQWVKTLEEGK